MVTEEHYEIHRTKNNPFFPLRKQAKQQFDSYHRVLELMFWEETLKLDEVLVKDGEFSFQKQK